MGGLSIWHWLIVAIIIMLLFGKGRISEMMGDLAKGIKSFKTGLADDDDPARPAESARLSAPPAPAGPAPAHTPEETATPAPSSSDRSH